MTMPTRDEILAAAFSFDSSGDTSRAMLRRIADALDGCVQGAVTYDRPTWAEVRHMLIQGYADGYEDHQCDVSGNPGSRADRIIAEFRKEGEQ